MIEMAGSKFPHVTPLGLVAFVLPEISVIAQWPQFFVHKSEKFEIDVKLSAECKCKF